MKRRSVWGWSGLALVVAAAVGAAAIGTVTGGPRSSSSPSSSSPPVQITTPGSTGSTAGQGGAGSHPSAAAGAGKQDVRPSGPSGGRTPARPVTGKTGKTGARPADLPAAPSGFASQVSGVYADIYKVNKAVSSRSPSPTAGLTPLPEPTSFAKEVNGLSQQELDELYAATRQDPKWTTVVSSEQKAAAESASLSKSAGGSASTSATVTSRQGEGRIMTDAAVTSSFPPPSQPGSFPAAPTPYVPSSPVAPYNPETCPTAAPGGPPDAPGQAAIYAMALTVGIATDLAADVPASIVVSILGEGTSIPDPAKYILEAIQLAATITLDTFNYLEAVAAGCATQVEAGFLANIDNTTVNTFNMLTAIEATLSNVESSVDTIGANLGVLQQTLVDQLTLALEQALTAPVTSVPNIAFELPASVGGNLDSIPVGVQQVVTQAISSLQSAGNPVNSAAVRDLAMANDALASGQYAAAYADYHSAYLQAVG